MSQNHYPNSLVDGNGNRIQIDSKPFAIGGEGALFGIANQPDKVAKLYHKTLSQDRTEKIKAMVASCNDQMLKIASWPTSTLHTKSMNSVDGIIMNRFVNFKEIHHLYSNAQRRKDFPNADWGFLVHSARNCAAAFDTIHSQGHTIGDVNQKNVMVSEKGFINLVDCDSFQIKYGSKIYRCTVGVPEYTPPELLGTNFSNVDRNQNHDLFGLAVLIFHLLMMGRHPFSGVPIGDRDIPIEKAISSGFYAYSRGSHSLLSPPPGVPPISMIEGTLRNLFEAAFEPRRDLFSNRPSAETWRVALDQTLTNLTRCKLDSKHTYPSTLSKCPWCDLIATNRLMFFIPSVNTRSVAFEFPDIELLNNRLVQMRSQFDSTKRPKLVSQTFRISTPNLLADLKPFTPKPNLIAYPSKPLVLSPPDAPASDPWMEILSLIFCATGLLSSPLLPRIGILVCIIFGSAYYFLRTARKTKEGKIMEELMDLYRHEVEAVQRDFDLKCRKIEMANSEKLEQWKSMNKDSLRIESSLKQLMFNCEREANLLQSQCNQLHQESGALFSKLETQAIGIIQKLKEVRKDYESEIRKAESTFRSQELETYLDTFLIQEAKLQSMSYNRILALESFGVETAKDVDSLRTIKVPGIGPVLSERLFAWREELIRSFRPSRVIPNEVKLRVDQKFSPAILPMNNSISTLFDQMNTIGRTNAERTQELERLFSNTCLKLENAKRTLEAFYELTQPK